MVKMTASGAPPVAIATRSRGSWLERLPSWAKSLVTLGALPDDPEEERLRKASLVLTASMITALAVVWVALRRSSRCSTGLYSEFDVIAERRQLEKIKTVGDAYMVVGGLPEPRPDAAEAAAEMALEMQDMVAGYRKFTYDLWGDTVNTASRTESHGIPGQIQVTPNAYERLRHHYRFQAREPMEVKGKGRIVPYLLLRRDQDAPTQREEA